MSLSESEPSTLKQLMADAQPAKTTPAPAPIQKPAAVQPAFVSQKAKRIDDPYAHAAKLMYEGKSRLHIVKELQSQGLSVEEAQQIYGEATRGMQSNYSGPDTDAAIKSMAIGALICVIGIVVTVGSYSAVARTGGSYTIAYGAIIVGGFRFLRGVYQYFN